MPTNGGSHRDEEQAAIEACRLGRIEGLALLYETYRVRVFRTCLRLLGDRASAEDATHEIFLRTFERMQAFEGRSAFSTWLYRLAVNACLNLLDKARLREALPAEHLRLTASPGAEPEESFARSEGEQRLLVMLGELSAEHRAVLVLREIEELSYAEIAGVLEIPVGTVMSRLARARDALRERWRLDSSAGSTSRQGRRAARDAGSPSRVQAGPGARRPGASVSRPGEPASRTPSGPRTASPPDTPPGNGARGAGATDGTGATNGARGAGAKTFSPSPTPLPRAANDVEPGERR